MKIITKIAKWLFTEQDYEFFSGTGFSLIFLLLVLLFVISCCVSKKIRKIFF